MPNYTKTIQLEKPLQTEAYDVDKRNANWDKIDAAITEDRDSADKHSKNPSAHANGIAGNAGSATKLKIARQIALVGKVTGSPVRFDGTQDVSINIDYVNDAEKLTNPRRITLSGDVKGDAYFDGSENIDIRIDSNRSDSADKLSEAQIIELVGDVTGQAYFDGSQPLEIVTTLAKESGILSGSVSNPDAWWVKLCGKIPIIIQGIHRSWVDTTAKQSCTFPIRFPHACLMAQNTIEYDTGSGDTNMDTVYNVTQTGMNYRCDTKCGSYLLVIGY